MKFRMIFFGRRAEALDEDRKVAALAHLPVRPRELDEMATAFARAGLHAALVKSAAFEEERYHPGDSTWENAGVRSAQEPQMDETERSRPWRIFRCGHANWMRWPPPLPERAYTPRL